MEVHRVFDDLEIFRKLQKKIEKRLNNVYFHKTGFVKQPVPLSWNCQLNLSKWMLLWWKQKTEKDHIFLRLISTSPFLRRMIETSRNIFHLLARENTTLQSIIVAVEVEVSLNVYEIKRREKTKETLHLPVYYSLGQGTAKRTRDFPVQTTLSDTVPCLCMSGFDCWRFWFDSIPPFLSTVPPVVSYVGAVCSLRELSCTQDTPMANEVF